MSSNAQSNSLVNIRTVDLTHKIAKPILFYQPFIHFLVVQEKKLKPGIEITHQLLSGVVDSTGKVFSVEKFEPIEVKHAISNTTSTDTGKV